MTGALGFLELGLIILAWMTFWDFMMKAWAAKHREHPAAQGLAAVRGF